jgi:hypothetical protein
MHLPGPADRQTARRDFLGYRRTGADDGPVADFYRGDQLGIAAHEDPVPDEGGMFFMAIIVAGDGARAHIHFFPKGGVSEVTEVIGLSASADHRFFYFYEIADPRSFPQDGLRA